MDEEFESFIVDPNLVDPELDISGLRTATDTRPELLFDLPEFSGIRVDPTRGSYIEDMYRAYSGQIPMLDIETPAAAPPATGGGGSGDGGQATAPMTGDSTATPIIPIEPGTFTAESLDESFAGEEGPITQPVTGGITGDPVQVEDLINYQFGDDPTGLDMSGTMGGAPVVSQQLQDQGPTTIEGPLSQVQVDGGLSAIDEERLAGYTPSFDTSGLTDATPEQRNTIQNILTAAGDNVQGALTELGKIPGAVVDFANQTVDLFGKKLNVGKTLASIALNKIAGGPVSLLFDVLPDNEPTFQQRTLTDELGLTDDRKFAGDPTTSAFAGLNAFGQFGDPVKTAKDRIDTRLENIENKNYGPGDKFYDDTQTMIEEYNRVTNKLGDIDTIPTGDAQIAEETIGTPPEITEARQKQGEQIQEIQQQKVVQSGSDEADRQQRDTGVAKVAENRYETKSGDVYASAAEAAEKSDGGGGGGGGGKIVCTMMNESYGFGSFRNKIWMKFHKDLSPEYQRGYHKLFLPLVKIAKKNMVVKKILEHIAVHSTIDMRQSMRGKTHLLGRIYRKILLPLCYWVGKNG